MHQADAGGGRSIKIAHCVGDVDKRTVSENLGKALQPAWVRRPHHAAARQGFGRRMRIAFREHRTVAPIAITYEITPVRLSASQHGAQRLSRKEEESQGRQKGRP